MEPTLFDKHLTRDEIEAGMPHVLDSPHESGEIMLIVRRPKVNKREVIETGVLDIENGLVGDSWLARGSSRMDNGLGHPEMHESEVTGTT